MLTSFPLELTSTAIENTTFMEIKSPRFQSPRSLPAVLTYKGFIPF